jgi:hypothetical protein
MRKFFIVLAVLFTAYVLHGRYVFSDGVVQQWLEGQTTLALQGNPKACEAYAEDVVVSISSENKRGRHALDGGKTEMCDYLMRTAEDMHAIKAVSSFEISHLRIIQREFPWTQAVVSYSRKVHILPPDRTVIDVQYADTLVLSRSASGLKIIRVNSVVYPEGH